MLLLCWIFTFMMFSEGRYEVQEIFAEFKSQVVLPCDCHAWSSLSITWTKDDQGTVWRQERSGLQFWGFRWLQRGQQRVRCPRCQLPGGDCSLLMSNVREHDDGVYTCKFKSGGQFFSRSLRLRVIKGIVHPSRDNTKVYAAVGSAATLPCVFSPGFNPSEPTWQKLKPGSAVQFLPSSDSSSQPILDKSANLKDISLEDEGTYRCSGLVEGQNLSRKVQLVVARIDRNIEPSKKSHTLTCQLTDTSEVTHYQWVRVRYDLSGTQLVKSIQEGKTLQLSEAALQDGGELVCQFYSMEGLVGNVTLCITPQSDDVVDDDVSDSAGSSYITPVALSASALLVLLLLFLAQTYKNHQRRKRILQFITLESILFMKTSEREAREHNQMKKGNP
ncbi:lymphocyte activation gene 3 protein-like isoform X2 [Corythoichthys intestinalis]|uniref:lymphocyte activation gene 3 protein-like isoform X2 n=1 Tax=Corythoichthys intestinalis TaxID=161448 RepID=UPI0025A4D4CB|nr:lymphocyte activation gene 3 protein-like isoform X2 [Corythoichthys intestinalis]XP_057689850.1 lymphocyte activation gene 3 protein-like isoform X2 [Corythoichthys intestinalis]XP_057689851.1 lymphocyte activation gene 3 protein-like isoform X2 [Corythoichthys intestinalis]XP_057689852.1 lymphocyte activation gene 3 protein-like isoform X2 [Corythoichthys intestinalis]XP_057689853.1 lymphocyte activation gene 3 protein-like isoform X2 [Corythoichthys intestinalis]XP_057689854.1 lymphocyte